MRKLLLYAAALLLVGSLCSASCTKVCTCDYYLLGLIVDTDEEEIPFGEKCTDLSDYDDGSKTGMKCR